jgi:hypothetical protein
MDQFTATAAARAGALKEKIAKQVNQASIRYIFTPIFPMIFELLSTTIAPGAIVPISEQGQPVGEVYLQTLVREGEPFDPSAYNMQNGIGEVIVNPAPIVDELLSQYGKQGTVQIKSLFNLDVDEFVGYGLNEIIFEGRAYDTAKAYHEQFAAVRAKYPAGSWPLLDRVLLELGASVDLAFAWARAEAELANQALKSGDIKRFAPREAKIFKFCGVTPIDEAMNQVAINQSSLAETLPKVVTDFKDAVIASKPDYSELGAAIAQGVKEGIKDLIQPAPAKEEPKPANKGGGKS